MTDITDYSSTPASNNAASPNGMPEGMAPSGVNDSWREGKARLRGYITNYTGGGSANAHTVTMAPAPSAYAADMRILFTPTAANTASATINANAIGVNTMKLPQGANLVGGELHASQLADLIHNGTNFVLQNPYNGRIVQEVEDIVTTNTTGTTTIPLDDTIPQQSTEGILVLSEPITPTDTNNILEIEFSVFAANSASGFYMGVALFQDSTENALVARGQSVNAANQIAHITYTYRMVAGTTSATTFKVHIGANTAGTTTLNGTGGNRRYGGICESYLRIKEITA